MRSRRRGLHITTLFIILVTKSQEKHRQDEASCKNSFGVGDSELDAIALIDRPAEQSFCRSHQVTLTFDPYLLQLGLRLFADQEFACLAPPRG